MSRTRSGRNSSTSKRVSSRRTVVPAIISALVLLLTAFQAGTSSAQVLVTSVSGSVTVDGQGTDSVGVDLFTQDEFGDRDQYLDSRETTGGDYSFELEGAGCFVLTFIAPEGQSFNGGGFLQAPFCVEAGETATVNAELDSNIPSEASIGGSVAETTGDPVANASVDLFLTAEDGTRGDFVESTVTDANGVYEFGAVFGCYTLTFVAPVNRTFVGGAQFFQQALCVDENTPTGSVDAVIQGEVPSDTSVGGTVTFRNGDVAEGVQVDLFLGSEAGGRGAFVAFTRTAEDGSYFFDVTEGCYVVTFIAPDGEVFVTGSQFLQVSTCVEAGTPVTDLNAVLDAEVVFPASIGGTVTEDGGAPIAGIEVTFWDTLGDGSRANYLGSETTDANGEYNRGMEIGCYWLIFVAPFGETFNDSQFLEVFQCVENGDTVTDLDAVLDGDVPPPTTTTTLPPTTTTTVVEPTTTTTVVEPTTTTTVVEPTTTTTVVEPTTTTTVVEPTTTTTIAPPDEITISVSDVTVTELDVDGIRNAQVVFTLSAPAEQTVVVDFTTVDGTATVADGDYIARSGELRFGPGRTSLIRAIRTLGDIEIEGDETLTVELSNPVNAIIGDGVGVVTIIDNDTAPTGGPF